MLSEAVCLQCGVLGADAPEMCATCAGPVYHLDRESEERMATWAIKARRERRGGMGLVYALIPGLACAVILTYLTDVFLLDASIVLLLSAPFYPLIAIYKRRRLPAGIVFLEQRLPGVQQRFWPRLVSGVPIVLALALVVIHVAVGELGSLGDWWMVPEHLRAGDDHHRLLSAALVHANAYHLLANLFGLLLFGIAVDLRVGRVACFTLVLICAATGSATHGYFTGLSAFPMLGASGIVYGLIGAELALMPTRKLVVFPMGMSLELPNFVGLIVFVGVFTAFDIAASPNIAWLGHLGGFAAGVVVGLMLRRIAAPAVFHEFDAWRMEKLERMKRDAR